MTDPTTETARDALIAYAATTRTVTADGLAPFLDALEASVRAGRAVPSVGRAALRDRIAALADDLRYVLGYTGPRHAHEQAGVWDTSGKPCEHCARLAVAQRNLAAYDADPGAVLPAPADRAAVLAEAADAVFALDYDVMVGEEGDENLGSMREAWDLGTIHAEKLLRRLVGEAAPDNTETRVGCRCKHPADEHSVYGCADGCGCEWMPARRTTGEASRG